VLVGKAEGILRVAGILNGTSLVARPFSSDVPARTIALTARPTSAHRRDFDLLAEFILTRLRETAKPMPPRRARTARTKTEPV
jgi:hypothetical protein